MTDVVTETWGKLNLLAATSILKYEKDESEVVNIGYQHCDRLNEVIVGIIKILKESPLVVSIEASESAFWKKYTSDNGLNFGINSFGKSAPYKKIYDYFGLNSKEIIKTIKKRL